MRCGFHSSKHWAEPWQRVSIGETPSSACESQTKRPASVSRALLIQMAQTWLHLAHQAEKNLTTDLVYETPPPRGERPVLQQQQQQVQPKKTAQSQTPPGVGNQAWPGLDGLGDS